MSADDARAGKIKLVPPAERKRCAFWRVWCLVELAAALAENKPVVMLVGSRVSALTVSAAARLAVSVKVQNANSGIGQRREETNPSSVRSQADVQAETRMSTMKPFTIWYGTEIDVVGSAKPPQRHCAADL